MHCTPPTRRVTEALAGAAERGDKLPDGCRTQAGEVEFCSCMLPGEWEAAALGSCSAALKAGFYILDWGPFRASGREGVGRNRSLTQVKNTACPAAPEVFSLLPQAGRKGVLELPGTLEGTLCIAREPCQGKRGGRGACKV